MQLLVRVEKGDGAHFKGSPMDVALSLKPLGLVWLYGFVYEGAVKDSN
jgi:hypothetical protein